MKKIIKRIRTEFQDPKKFIRLHRAEYGHNFQNKKISNYKLNNVYYPDVTVLSKRISKFHRLSNSFINLGLGAESLIRDIFIWHSRKFKLRRIGFGIPTYAWYRLNAKIYDYKIFNFYYYPSKIKDLTVSVIKRFIVKNNLNFLVLINPSHPIEKNWPTSELEEIVYFCKKKRVIILVDEVFQVPHLNSADFLTKKYSNLIVVRSFSKAFGLPGIRVGYSMACKKLKEEIETYRMAIELPKSSIDEALKALKNFKTSVKQRFKKIDRARTFAHKEFKKRGLKSYNNYHNAVSVDLRNVRFANKIGKYLKKNRIFINYQFPSKLGQYVNLTTTYIPNLRFFFTKFDKIAKKIKLI
jgi:histidinol-phosphate/aromatic aminotransferase/cobyric acid decarboxylase-like protein